MLARGGEGGGQQFQRVPLGLHTMIYFMPQTKDPMSQPPSMSIPITHLKSKEVTTSGSMDVVDML